MPNESALLPVTLFAPGWDAAPLAVARWDQTGSAPTIPEWFFEAVETESTPSSVEVDECDVVYRTWQSTAERDMLLIHGMNAHSRWWDFIAPKLTDAYRVVAMDLTGMGDSDYRYSYDADTYAKEIVGVCDAAGLNEKVIVVGHSFGGNVATKAANLYPDRFGALILVDSGLRHPDEPLLDYPPMSGRAKVYPDRETALARFRLQPPQPCENAYILEYIARHSLMPVDGGWAWKFDDDLPFTLKDAERAPEDYTGLTLPVRLIYGAESKLFTDMTREHLESLLPGEVRSACIGKARHHLFLDQPLAFVDALRKLCESLDDAG